MEDSAVSGIFTARRERSVAITGTCGFTLAGPGSSSAGALHLAGAFGIGLP